MNWIDYRSLPQVGGITELFKDYVSEFKKVQQFYELDYQTLDNFGVRCEKIRSEYRLRYDINGILLRQNKDFGCSEETFININKLEEENTFAIVTGQQVGILSGPLYTIYKIITLLKLTELLNKRYQNLKFVPVFWLEGEDHDFEEVNKVKILDQENRIKTIEYLMQAKQNQHGSVGSYVFDHQIENFIKELSSALPSSEFKSNIIEAAAAIYTEGSTFESAFVKWINQLFPQSGIIFFSSNDKEVKLLLSGIFQKEINECPNTSRLVIQKSAELEDNYHVQMKPRALNLFMFYKGGRYLIEPREHDFSLKGTRHYLTKEELLQIATQTPEQLSPNVVLRPICQDTLLPTAAYIAGPSEIAYFAQLKSVYKHFDITMPIIYPRVSVTLVEDKVMRILEKYELSVRDIFNGIETVTGRVVDFVSEVKIDDLFSDSYKRIDDILNEMKFGLGYIDQTLLGALETTRIKIEENFKLLNNRTIMAQKRKHEIAIKQVEKALNHLFPGGNFQERELNIINYLNKYGTEFPQWLMREIDIDKFKQQIVEIT